MTISDASTATRRTAYSRSAWVGGAFVSRMPNAVDSPKKRKLDAAPSPISSEITGSSPLLKTHTHRMVDVSEGSLAVSDGNGFSERGSLQNQGSRHAVHPVLNRHRLPICTHRRHHPSS